MAKAKKWQKQGPGFVGSHHLTRHAIFLGVTALAVTMADAHRGASLAQGKLDARYTVTLSGLPIGQGAWIIDIGDDYFLANYQQLKSYWEILATQSERFKLVTIGKTEEGRPQLMGIVTSPTNHKKLEHY